MIRNYILMSISMNWWLDLDARMLEMKPDLYRLYYNTSSWDTGLLGRNATYCCESSAYACISGKCFLMMWKRRDVYMINRI